MGYLYLVLVAFLFSFGGTCAKIIGPYFSSEYISFFRFVFGVFFLLLLKFVTKHHFRNDFKEQFKKVGIWLFFGAAGKEISYLAENYGLTHGVSYGNILVQPVQLLFILLVSVVVFKEKLTKRKAMFIVPCILGTILVSWNGRSINDYLSGNLALTLLYVVAGIGAACHIISQKKVADSMDVIDSNLTLFMIASCMAFFPIIKPTMGGALVGVKPSLACILAMLLFGFNTGIGFYFNAKAIPLVPFYMVPIIQCFMVFFSIAWGILFFHESITIYIVIGTLMFVAGIIGIQTDGAFKKK